MKKFFQPKYLITAVLIVLAAFFLFSSYMPGKHSKKGAPKMDTTYVNAFYEEKNGRVGLGILMKIKGDVINIDDDKVTRRKDSIYGAIKIDSARDKNGKPIFDNVTKKVLYDTLAEQIENLYVQELTIPLRPLPVHPIKTDSTKKELPKKDSTKKDSTKK